MITMVRRRNGGLVTDGTPAIETRELRRTFKGGVEAVRGIDLTIAEGEVFGFLGPNGAGKTTTVRILCTLLPPTAGGATVSGPSVCTRSARGGRPHRGGRPASGP